MANTFRLDHLNTEVIELPHDVVERLKAEAKKSRLSVAEFLMQWLEDQADIREATAVLKRVQAGKEKTSPAQEVFDRLRT